MGAGLCGSSTVNTVSDCDESAKQKVERWLLDSKEANSAAEHPASRSLELVKSVNANPSSRPSSARSDTTIETTMSKKWGANAQRRWKTVRNVVHTAHALQEKPANKASAYRDSEDEELTTISEHQAQALRSEFESISAPRATMDFQKLQKLQACLIPSNLILYGLR